MSVFLSLFLLFSNFTVKANELTFPSFPLPVEGKSTTHYLIYHYENDYNDVSIYYLIQPLDPSTMDFHRSYSGAYDHKIQFHGSPAIIYSWKEGDTSWEKIREIGNGEEYIPINYYDLTTGRTKFIYSSFDLYDDYGDIFFQKAPIKATFLHQMREVEMGATMMTVVSLIPLLILSLVSLMGFRKAWAWLSKVLRKA